MKHFFLILLFFLTCFIGKGQFILFLDKGDIFKSPETDMVVMDKISFARLHYTSEKYDTLKMRILHYDSLLEQKDSAEVRLRKSYQHVIANKDRQIEALTDGYTAMKAGFQQSIEQQNKLQVDYLKLEKKNRRAKRWRNFFMGTSAVFGAAIYLIIR